MPNQWSPILRGQRRQAAIEAARQVAASLVQRRLDLTIDPFTAILFAELSATIPGGNYLDIALEVLDASVDRLETTPTGVGLHGGFCGVAWLSCWFRQRYFPSTEHSASAPEDDPCADIDRTLAMMVEQWDGASQDYDLISGLVGVGVYALQRVHLELGRKVVEGVIDRLSQCARSMNDSGIAWWHSPTLLPVSLRPMAASGLYNLGIAHGVPGVIGFLGHAYNAGIRKAESRRLCAGAISWILKQRIDDPESGGFPSWLAEGVPPRPARVAWCYGGLGISASLMVAAKTMGIVDWEREAVQLALAEASRDSKQSGVVDACLCHGAAGNALIFQRLFSATGDERFFAAASDWFERALIMNRTGEGADKYRFWIGTELREDPRFLTGNTGVALALLAGISDCPPTWDRLLLTDIPCGQGSS